MIQASSIEGQAGPAMQTDVHLFKPQAALQRRQSQGTVNSLSSA